MRQPGSDAAPRSFSPDTWRGNAFTLCPVLCAVKLNGSRMVTGTLRGFDQFMNIVLDETVEEVSASEQNKIGMVVIRGNSIVMIEALEKLWD